MDKGTLIRTITALVVAIIDLLRVLTGIEVHVAQDEIMTVVSLIVGAWVWWKNNPITPEAKAANKMMLFMKSTRDFRAKTVEEPEDVEVK